jgi:endoglucanase
VRLRRRFSGDSKTLGGVPTVNPVVPVRYTHSHNGILNRRDFDQMVELLVAIEPELDRTPVAKIRDFAHLNDRSLSRV